MTVYTYGQLQQLWINNGGDTSVASVAGAIALAESDGDNYANNYNDSNGLGGTQTSWGLWQISNGTHSEPVPNIDDPDVNAQQAVIKYRDAGNQFTPWGTFTSGAYLRFLDQNTPPDQNVPSPSGGPISNKGAPPPVRGADIQSIALIDRRIGQQALRLLWAREYTRSAFTDGWRP